MRRPGKGVRVLGIFPKDGGIGGWAGRAPWISAAQFRCRRGNQRRRSAHRPAWPDRACCGRRWPFFLPEPSVNPSAMLPWHSTQEVESLLTFWALRHCRLSRRSSGGGVAEAEGLGEGPDTHRTLRNPARTCHCDWGRADAYRYRRTGAQRQRRGIGSRVTVFCCGWQLTASAKARPDKTKNHARRIFRCFSDMAKHLSKKFFWNPEPGPTRPTRSINT